MKERIEEEHGGGGGSGRSMEGIKEEMGRGSMEERMGESLPERNWGGWCSGGC